MKNPIIAALMVGMLGLAGCSNTSEASIEATHESKESTSAPVESKSAPSELEAPIYDVASAKAAAIKSGRPEAAWDNHCVAWEMPEEDTKGQAWANKLGNAFLESKSAGCPDAIMNPYYFIESFTPGAPGELILNLDPAINRTIWGSDPGVHYQIEAIAEGVMAGIMDANPSVKTVTAQTPGGKRYGRTDRAQADKVRADGGIL